MTKKQPAAGRPQTTENLQAGAQLYLDHGAPSLIAQDSPDDSQLGAPKTPGQRRSTATE